MRIFIVYLALSWAYGVALGQDDDESQSGITYQLQVHRFDILTPENDFVVVKPPREPGLINKKVNNGELPIQYVTYLQPVDYDTPYLLFGDITYDNDTVDLLRVPEINKLNVCADYDDGTWLKVIMDLAKTEAFPNATCPVKPGNFTMFADFQVDATFYQPLKCGDYRSYVILFAGTEWVLYFDFKFNVTMDVDNCVPP